MAQFACNICGDGFEQKSKLDRHKMTSHPEQVISAADLEKAIKSVSFPKSKQELVDSVRQFENEEVVEIFREFPDQEYRDAAEVARVKNRQRFFGDKVSSFCIEA